MHKPKGILFHWYNPNSHANPVISRSFFRRGTCQKAEPKSNVVKNLASPSREALVYSRCRVCISYRYRVQVAKVATKSKLPTFFFAITTPQAHGDFEGSITSYSSNISISARHASDLCGVIRLAPSLWGTAPSSSLISCSTKLQKSMSALCLEITSAFRFKTARRSWKSPSPIFPFKCSISGKTRLSDSSSYDEGRSRKFEQLVKPSSESP